MRISDFYEDVLGARLANLRWSWGAHDALTNRVYLRVWDDHIVQRDDGRHVLVARGHPWRRSSGNNEPRRHLDQVQSQGAEGYGIVCTAVAPSTTDTRRIKSFDHDHLLRLGYLSSEGDDTYAHVVARVSGEDLRRPPTGEATLAADVLALGRKQGDPTTKEALISARVGQGAFRVAVLDAWGDACAVTGIRTLDTVRASHIKPWRDSEDDERLDPANGLPLMATLDAPFDAGLISFADTGAILFSLLLDEAKCGLLGLTGLALIRAPSAATASYLAHHREHVLRS